jgi:uncharacterized protein (TIGR02118 family)
MIKTIIVAHRKAGISREQFNDHWVNIHGPLAAKHIPGLRKYVQNHLVEVPGMEFPGDGVVEMWYNDITAWKKSLTAVGASEELREDAVKFCGMGPAGNGGMWIVEEHVIKDELQKK